MPSEPSRNSEELFVQLFAQHERDLRAFLRSMGLGWNEVDDVIQTVSLILWRKWNQFDPETDFLKWARVVARFEVLKFRRTMARDRHVFREDLLELLAEAALEQEEAISRERYRESLEACLDELPAKSRSLIQAVYHGERTIKAVAEEVGQSATALYKALDRIRKGLQTCIERRLATESF